MDITKIGNLLKKGLLGMVAFTSVMFSLVHEIGFVTRNRNLTVVAAFLLIASGLTIHMTLAPLFFYGYIACIFASGLMLRGYNSARAKNHGELSFETNPCQPASNQV